LERGDDEQTQGSRSGGGQQDPVRQRGRWPSCGSVQRPTRVLGRPQMGPDSLFYFSLACGVNWPTCQEPLSEKENKGVAEKGDKQQSSSGRREGRGATRPP
jgi:hypothetical protein